MLPEINRKFVYVLQVIVHYILMHMNHSLGSVLMHASQLLRGDVTFYLVSVQLTLICMKEMKGKGVLCVITWIPSSPLMGFVHCMCILLCTRMVAML